MNDGYTDIPAELYADDAVRFIAGRYHVTSQEAVRCCLEQCGKTSCRGAACAFRLEDNEVEIIKGLIAAYHSPDKEMHRYI